MDAEAFRSTLGALQGGQCSFKGFEEPFNVFQWDYAGLRFRYVTRQLRSILRVFLKWSQQFKGVPGYFKRIVEIFEAFQ